MPQCTVVIDYLREDTSDAGAFLGANSTTLHYNEVVCIICIKSPFIKIGTSPKGGSRGKIANKNGTPLLVPFAGIT